MTTTKHVLIAVWASGLVFQLAAAAHPHPGGEHGAHAESGGEVSAETRPVVPATGALEYEVVPGWCKLPDARGLGNTHGGIVIDANGLVYFNTDTERSIMVHEASGEFVRAVAPEFPAIHGMVIRTEENDQGGDEQFIYGAHLGGRQVVKLTLDGRAVWTLGVPDESGHYEGAAYSPTSVAVAPNGDIFVADGYSQNWIHQYSADLKYIRSFGGPGEAPGAFRTCHGIAIDPRGEAPTLLVCDRENRRLQRFTLDGEFIEIVATDLRRPCSVSIWGEYTAVAELEGRVTVLDAEFRPAVYLGDNPDQAQWAQNGVPPEQWVEGVFTAPHAVCFDPDGNLYVMDWNAAGRVSKFRLVESGD